jgi:predicted proteasome-type protease
MKKISNFAGVHVASDPGWRVLMVVNQINLAHKLAQIA